MITELIVRLIRGVVFLAITLVAVVILLSITVVLTL